MLGCAHLYRVFLVQNSFHDIGHNEAPRPRSKINQKLQSGERRKMTSLFWVSVNTLLPCKFQAKIQGRGKGCAFIVVRPQTSTGINSKSMRGIWLISLLGWQLHAGCSLRLELGFSGLQGQESWSLDCDNVLRQVCKILFSIYYQLNTSSLCYHLSILSSLSLNALLPIFQEMSWGLNNSLG